MRYVNCIVLGVVFCLIPMVVPAGNLDSPAAPTEAGSAMFTLEDIYQRLDDGTAGAKRSGAFTEPLAGPTVGTGHTLDEVMGKAPAVDANNGAGSADVAEGKTFWGLTSGAWGLQTGDLAGGGGSSYEAGVARTGQTTTVPLNPADGSDGNLHKGVAWPNPRFTANTGGEAGTVTDNLTGLMWAQNANAAGTKTWTDALSYCNNLSLGGHDDWRLPNVKELFSLIDWAYSNPVLSNDAGTGKWADNEFSAFTGVQSSYYWSSTTFAGYTGFAWYVGMDYGDVNYDGKDGGRYVWPVRGGQ